jgi:ketosteroid isomerase-like protein
MGLIEELAIRLDRVEAELALHRLANDYCIGADHRDLARWQSVWTSDAVWQTSPDRAYRGIEEITAAVTGQWQAFPIMQHSTANHVVQVTGETGTGHCDVIVQIQLGDGRWLVGGGAYQDEYRRETDGWKIARRTVVRPFDLPPIPAAAAVAPAAGATAAP